MAGGLVDGTLAPPRKNENGLRRMTENQFVNPRSVRIRRERVLRLSSRIREVKVKLERERDAAENADLLRRTNAAYGGGI
jgi:hypothetical protein